MSGRSQAIALFRGLWREIGLYSDQKQQMRARLVTQFHSARSESPAEVARLVTAGQTELELIRAVREHARTLEEAQWGLEVDQRRRVERTAAHVGLAMPLEAGESKIYN
jgi:hypothetical protein